MGDIDEHFVYRVHMHVFGCYVIEVNLVYLRGILYVQVHSRRCHYICKALGYLKHSGTAADSARAKRWRHCETDRFVASCRIRNNQIGRHRIESSLNAFNRCIERLEVYAHEDVAVFAINTFKIFHSACVTTESFCGIRPVSFPEFR